MGVEVPRILCTGCGDVIAHHEHVWIEDEHGDLRPWSPDLPGAGPKLAGRAWHAACVIDDLPPILG
jgi:hypothetical protein